MNKLSIRALSTTLAILICCLCSHARAEGRLGLSLGYGFSPDEHQLFENDLYYRFDNLIGFVGALRGGYTFEASHFYVGGLLSYAGGDSQRFDEGSDYVDIRARSGMTAAEIGYELRFGALRLLATGALSARLFVLTIDVPWGDMERDVNDETRETAGIGGALTAAYVLSPRWFASAEARYAHEIPLSFNSPSLNTLSFSLGVGLVYGRAR